VTLLGRLAAALSGKSVDERLRALERGLAKLAEAGRDHAASTDRRLEDLAQAIEGHPTAKDLRELRQAVRGISSASPAQPVLEALEHLGADGRPVVIGPWTGEVGFELLYWIPFVEWVRSRWKVPHEQEIVVSRGGVASWYGQTSDRYVDVLSLVGADEFRTGVAEEKRKHRRAGPFDERITQAAVRVRGLDAYDTLHPGLMFRAFAPYWSDEAGYALIDQFTRPRLMARPVEPLVASLPESYVAVRFYFSDCLPDTSENRAFARRVVAALAERQPVVLLNPGCAVDEHSDWLPDLPQRIITIQDGLRPERNLAVQSAVIAGAKAFVGTYGGYSYLAPLYQVPALSFYSRPTFKLHHLHAAQRVFAQVGAASLMPVDVAQASLVQSALGSLVAA
jgi:hypothetical protein